MFPGLIYTLPDGHEHRMGFETVEERKSGADSTNEFVRPILARRFDGNVQFDIQPED